MTDYGSIYSFSPDDKRIPVIQWHISHYPRMLAVDLIKMIYQAVFGNHHIQGDLSDIQASIRRELAAMNHRGAAKGVIDPLAADRGWMRIHLVPFMEGGGDPKTLARSVLYSAGIPPGSTGAFLEYINVAQYTLRTIDCDIRPSDLEKWKSRCRNSGFSPVSHSSVYRSRYHPAYRVVHASVLERLKMKWVTRPDTNDNIMEIGEKDE